LGTTGLAAAAVPRHLHDRGLWQVVAPLSTLDGEPWHRADGYQFALYPFVAGPQASDAGLTDDQWVEYGAFLGALHHTVLPAELAALVPEDTYVCASVANVRSTAEHARHSDPSDPVSRELVTFWRERDDEIAELADRTERLGDLARTRRLSHVLCHTDIHAANILVDIDGRLRFVDWDTPVLAPPERDLIFVVGEGSAREEELFWQGYGRHDVDRDALAYYKCARVVEDIDAFAHSVLFRDDLGELTRRNDLQWFRAQFPLPSIKGYGTPTSP
jgi:spectinomycin phosphotransferase